MDIVNIFVKPYEFSNTKNFLYAMIIRSKKDERLLNKFIKEKEEKGLTLIIERSNITELAKKLYETKN